MTERDDLRRLVHAYTEGSATAAQLGELSARITADPADARRMAEWMLLTSDLAELMNARRATRNAQRGVRSAPTVPRSEVRVPRWPYALAAALLLAAGVTLAVVVTLGGGALDADTPAPRGPVVAVMQGAADANFDSPPIAIGDDVFGEPIAIRSGVLQMELRDGGAALLHGPATVRFDSPTRAQLTGGWMRVRGVPGFTVDLPHGVSVIDLSTEFEVSVGADGASAVRVIEGRVRVVRPAASLDRALAAGEVLVLDAAGAPVDDPARLVDATGIDRRPTVIVPLPSTGAGLNPGEADARWTVVRRGVGEPAVSVPARAIRLVQPEFTQPAADSDARWISVDQPDGRAASDSMYTFAATFDLPDLDPTTVRLAGRLSVDNTVIAVRVNGTLVEPTGDPLADFHAWHTFAIDRGFVAGRNVVEFDVRNEVDPEPTSPMGLIVQWSATGLPDWIGRD